MIDHGKTSEPKIKPVRDCYCDSCDELREKEREHRKRKDWAKGDLDLAGALAERSESLLPTIPSPSLPSFGTLVDQMNASLERLFVWPRHVPPALLFIVSDRVPFEVWELQDFPGKKRVIASCTTLEAAEAARRLFAS